MALRFDQAWGGSDRGAIKFEHKTLATRMCPKPGNTCAAESAITDVCATFMAVIGNRLHSCLFPQLVSRPCAESSLRWLCARKACGNKHERPSTDDATTVLLPNACLRYCVMSMMPTSVADSCTNKTHTHTHMRRVGATKAGGPHQPTYIHGHKEAWCAQRDACGPGKPLGRAHSSSQRSVVTMRQGVASKHRTVKAEASIAQDKEQRFVLGEMLAEALPFELRLRAYPVGRQGKTRASVARRQGTWMIISSAPSAPNNKSQR